MKRLLDGKVVKCCNKCPNLCGETDGITDVIYCALMDYDYYLEHEVDYGIIDEEFVASLIGMKICRYCPLPDAEVGE